MKSILAPLAAALVIASAGCSTASKGEDPALLFGRLWLEARPQKPTDHVHGVFALPRPALGLFSRSSAYDFHAERFDYSRDGNKLKMTFPQNGRTAELSYTITACDSTPPFDLCLDLSENPWNGPKRYYGVREQDEDDAALRMARAQLESR